MVHLRLNANEANPNDAVNFITALPARTAAAETAARELLRALAAQVKPIMKAHGLVVNSFEEYEFNTVFAGRNWNNGETVEIVLRGSGGAFLPMGSLLNTLCHELAHIQHMNHGPDFQALWAQLRLEVEFLQSQGYYGDGFWSSGTRLRDAAEVGGGAGAGGELPEYICGGGITGAQTAKRRKAGSRVTAKDAFGGGGTALNADAEDKKAGAGFRKQAGSKKAREERAAAIERRLAALQGGKALDVKPISPKEEPQSETESDDDDAVEIVPETDAERRAALGAGGALAGAWAGADDCVATGASGTAAGGSGGGGALSGEQRRALLVHSAGPGSASPASTFASSSAGPGAGPSKKADAAPGLALGRIVQDEVAFRRKEAVGLAGAGAVRRLGGAGAGSRLVPPAPASPKGRAGPAPKAEAESDTEPDSDVEVLPASSAPATLWECGVCTLQNEQGHLACAACATPKGETSYRER